MKKTVNIIKIAIFSLIAIVILCGVIVLVVSLVKPQEQSGEGQAYTGNPYAALFRMDDRADIVAFANENGLAVNDMSEHYIAIENMEFSGKSVYAGFTLLGDKVTALSGHFSMFEIDDEESIELKIDTLQEEINWITAFLGEILEAEIENYSVCDEDGFQIDPADPESYQAVCDGKASVSISVKDQAGTYWEAATEYDHEGKLYFRYGHYFDAEMFQNVVANNVIS